jgi:hypothetical protein
MATLVIRTTIIKAIQSALFSGGLAQSKWDKHDAKVERLSELVETVEQEIKDWLGEQPVYIASDDWTVQADHRGNVEYWVNGGYYRNRENYSVKSPPKEMLTRLSKAQAAWNEARDNRPQAPLLPAHKAELQAYLAKFKESRAATVSVPDKVMDLLPSDALA